MTARPPGRSTVPAAARVGLDLARRSARWAIRTAARDVTQDTARRSAVIVAPHPDDETLGCGATVLHKVRHGTPVTLLMVTDGRHSHRTPYLPPEHLGRLRREETIEAVRRLGLGPDAVHWADLPDGAVTDHEDDLADLLAKVIAERRPDEVYATCADEPHPDHAAVGRAARRAVAAARTEVRLLEYPIWLWGGWPITRAAPLRSAGAAARLVWRRHARTVRTDGVLASKMHALTAHRSQLVRPDVVPPEADWRTLPHEVVSEAGGPVELFLPVEPP